MTEGNDVRVEHPEELLVGYVDGSASPDERRAVEAHLAGCSQCREDVALATRGRTALLALPEMEAPGLASQGLEALRGAANQQAGGDEVAARRGAKQETRLRRRWQASWPAVAAVAAVLALFAIVPLVLNKGGGGQSTGALTPQAGTRGAEAANYPPVHARGSTYDQDSIRALARQLGETERRLLGKGGQTTSAPTASPTPAGPEFAADAAAGDIVQCAIRATGLPSTTIPKYLETATYKGAPAYVVAILTEGGTKQHLRVYVVSRQECKFLYEADQPV